MQNSHENPEFTVLQTDNRRLREQVSQMHLDIQHLEAAVRYLQGSRFSPSSERHVSLNQLPLLLDQTETPRQDESSDNVTDIAAHKRKKKRPTIPVNTPRQVVHHDIPDSEKVCPHHGVPLERDGEKRSIQVEWIPAKIKVIEHVCATYGCSVCDKTVKAAEPPPSPIPGSMATPSLLAQIATSKFADGLPLYRQEGILARSGIDLSRTTMATWMGQISKLLLPLCNLYNDAILESHVIYMDETHLQVLNVPGKSATSKSYLWVRVGHTAAGNRVVLFHFDPSRSGDIPLALLDGYRGFLMTDDYSGYIRVASLAGIRRQLCWMHARRYFKKAFKLLGKAGKGGIADQALGKIRKLYEIERQGEDLSPEDRHRLRQDQSKPLLDEFQRWLQQAQKDVPPKGGTATAIAYTLDNWPGLLIYLEDGRLRMDNSPAENAIRPVAIGRKNFLFSDSVGGAEATAVLYSIVETAKANGLDPFAYLRHVLERLPVAKTLADIEALLPWSVSLAKAA